MMNALFRHDDQILPLLLRHDSRQHSPQQPPALRRRAHHVRRRRPLLQ